jgi:pentafunctional AROM polypeptide
MSATAIRNTLSLLGEVQPMQFYLFGTPISASRSPALHNTLFRQMGLPHQYSLEETDDVERVKKLIRTPDFGGASVTIPLKLDVIPLLDEISSEARVIGAVNTIVPIAGQNEPSVDSASRKLVGINTDYQGMVRALSSAGVPPPSVSSPASGLVIGSGGTSRAAIYALHSMGFSPIYIAARTPAKVEDLISSFPQDYHLLPLCSTTQLPKDGNGPSVAIGTIPASDSIAAELREVLCSIFTEEQNREDRGLQARKAVLLEMAYKPSVTPLMQLAIDVGWEAIPGAEALVAQGIYQFQLWTGIMPLYEDARVSQASHPYLARRSETGSTNVASTSTCPVY